MFKCAAESTADCDRVVQEIAKHGGTPLVVVKDQLILGVIHLKDIMKDGVQEKIRRFVKWGLNHHDYRMITLTAAAIAAEAGVDDFLGRGNAGRKAGNDPKLSSQRASGSHDGRRDQ